MSNGLTQLLMRADYSPLVQLSYDEVLRWAEGELDRCLAGGLLSPSSPLTTLTCDECGEWEDVLLLDNPISGSTVAYLQCAQEGTYRIDSRRLRRWQLTMPDLIGAAFRDVPLSGIREEIAPGQVWRLGRAKWGEGRWNLFFGRGLYHRNGADPLRKIPFPARSVLFVPSQAPRPGEGTDCPPVISLETVLRWEDERLAVDHEQVERQLADEFAARHSPPTDRPLRKRATRAAAIEGMERLLAEHLRAARDYAVATRDRTGSPQLLPRPQQDFLARQLDIDKSTVTRCLQDASATKLRFLWDIALDMDQILATRGAI